MRGRANGRHAHSALRLHQVLVLGLLVGVACRIRQVCVGTRARSSTLETLAGGRRWVLLLQVTSTSLSRRRDDGFWMPWPHSTFSLMGASARLPKLVRSLASAAPPPVRVPAELCGSAPSLTRHLVLNTSHSHLTWPSHIESVSPLYRELGARWGMKSGFSDLGFAFTDAGFAQGGGAGEKEWDPETPRVETPETSEEE